MKIYSALCSFALGIRRYCAGVAKGVARALKLAVARRRHSGFGVSRRAHASLKHEARKCRSDLDMTSRWRRCGVPVALRDSGIGVNSIRNRFGVASILEFNRCCSGAYASGVAVHSIRNRFDVALV